MVIILSFTASLSAIYCKMCRSQMQMHLEFELEGSKLGYCILSLVTVYSNSFTFCNLYCHHVVYYVFTHWTRKKIKIYLYILFSTISFLLFHLLKVSTVFRGRPKTRIPCSAFDFFSSFFLVLPFACRSSTKRGPPCRAGQPLPTSKSQRSHWAFDIKGGSQFHWKKILYISDQVVMKVCLLLITSFSALRKETVLIW